MIRRANAAFLIFALVLAVPLQVHAEEVELPYDLVSSTRTIMALTAAENAIAVFNGEPYDWSLNNSCSSYAGEYLRQLGFPMGPRGKSNREGAASPHPFPAVSTIEQVPYIEANFPQFVQRVTVLDFLAGNYWGDIHPGSLVYLERGISHNGYNTWQHVAILLGYNSAGEPIFADFAVGMGGGPQAGRTLEELARMYPRDREGEPNTQPYPAENQTPEELTVLIFDAVGASRTLWTAGGVVYPNSQGIGDELGAEVVLTVNVNDGTTALFAYQKGRWELELIGSRLEYYAVVGRYLNAHQPLSLAYRKEGQKVSGLSSFYDGEYGVLYERGVMRRTYTPLMIARVDGFQVVTNFGNIGGRTDIALLYPLHEGLYGRWEEATVRSDYTFHEVPRGTPMQEILLREPDLKRTNDPSDPLFGPLAAKNRSSGCINFDGISWKVLKGTLQGYLDEGKTVVVVFSVPGLDNDLLVAGKPTWNMTSDPVSSVAVSRWLYGDSFDRRGFFEPEP